MKVEVSKYDNVRWRSEKIRAEIPLVAIVGHPFNRDGVRIYWPTEEMKRENPVTAAVSIELSEAEARHLYEQLGKVLGQ